MKKIMMIAAMALMVVQAACAKTEYPEAPAYRGAGDGRLPLMASYAFSQPFINSQQFRWVKDAGFNMIRQCITPEELDSTLVLARKYDIEVAVCLWGLANTTNLPGYLRRYRNQKMIWGYSLGDEPGTSGFPKLRELEKQVEEIAPHQMGYINLFPEIKDGRLESKDYRDYVERYVQEVNPPFISVDVYPVRIMHGEVYVDDFFYRTMNVISSVAQESKRPFWSYVMCDKYNIYPTPKRAYLLFQVFGALAYGAQGFAYFTYQLPDFDKGKWEFSDAPLDWDGKRTATWYMVRDVNRELINLDGVFKGMEVLSVTQSGAKIPEGTKRLGRLPAPFRALESDGEGVMVSHFRNGSHEYLMLVNRDVNRKQKVWLSRTQPVMRIYGNGKEKLEKGPNLTLEAGGYAVYRIR